MAAANSMPLTKPRQAFVTSKFWHDRGRPNAWCTATAVEGSRYLRLTEVLIMTPIPVGSTPLSLIALAPAMAAPSTKVPAAAPPAPPPDPREPLHQPRTKPAPPIGVGQGGVEIL